MKTRRGAVCLVHAALIFSALPAALAQQRDPGSAPGPAGGRTARRRRRFPSIHPAPSARPRRSVPPVDSRNRSRMRPNPEQPPPESPPAETEAPDRRQLDYANGLFRAKALRSGDPGIRKIPRPISRRSRPGERLFLPRGMLSRAEPQRRGADQFPKRAGQLCARANLPGPLLTASRKFFSTKRITPGRSRFFIAPRRNRRNRRWLFRRAISKRAAWRTSIARTKRRTLYQQVAEAKNPNPYRDDARLAAGSIALARGRKADAFRNYEALANETQKPALKAEATVRAGMVAVDLQQTEKGKVDKAMAEKALSLLQKGRSLAGSGTLARDRGGRIAPAAISVRPVRKGAGGIQTRPGANPGGSARGNDADRGQQSAPARAHEGSGRGLSRRSSRNIRTGRKRRTRSISG